MPRLAYVCQDPGVPVFGSKGCSVHVQEVLRGLRHAGVAVELFAIRRGGVAPDDLCDLRVHDIPIRDTSDYRDRERALQDANAVTHELLARHGPFDIIYERYALWSNAAMSAAHANGSEGLLEVNAPLIDEQRTHRGLGDERSARALTRSAFLRASGIIAVSRSVADYVCSIAPAAHVAVVPNGVNPQRFAPDVRPALSFGPAAFVVGFVGSLKPWHGLGTLADAFALLARRLSVARLLIVGDGPERASLVRQLEGHGLRDRVHLTGAVRPESVPNYLTTMHAAVAPYEPASDNYFSPLKVVEYMAAARPVVASSVGELQSLVRDGTTGLLVPPGSPAALAEALGRLHSDRVLSQRLGTAARAEVCLTRTWEKVVARTLQLAQSARARRGGLQYA